MGNFLARAEQQHAAPQADHVTIAKDAKLDVFAVDLGAVGAFQIRDDDLVLVFLNLDVEAADPLVVELDAVPFFASDGYRRGKIVVDAAAVGAVEYPKCDPRHKPPRADCSAWLPKRTQRRRREKCRIPCALITAGKIEVKEKGK